MTDKNSARDTNVSERLQTAYHLRTFKGRRERQPRGQRNHHRVWPRPPLKAVRRRNRQQACRKRTSAWVAGEGEVVMHSCRVSTVASKDGASTTVERQKRVALDTR